MRQAIAGGIPEGLSGEDLLRLNFESVGMRPPEPTPELIRATWSAVREFPSWEAEIPVDPIAEATWPKLVISGTWER